MDVDIALIGIAFSLVGMLGGIIARDRQVMKMIHDGDEKNSNNLKLAENQIHERINTTVKDFNKELNSIRESNHDLFVGKEHFTSCVDGLKREIKSVNAKLDILIERNLK